MADTLTVSSPDFRRRLWAVLVLNAGMFAVEMSAGLFAGSRALRADALDFLADAFVYALALTGWPRGQIAQGSLVGGLALWLVSDVLGAAVMTYGPDAGVMGVTALAALAINALSVVLLLPHRQDGAKVWASSRYDMAGNALVLLAAVAVWFSQTMWADAVVGGMMAAFVLVSSVRLLVQGLRVAA